jgi:CPA1 family monovalent cation:H+ antiporter
VGTFLAILSGEIVYGIAIGWLMLRVRHAARDPRVEMTLSLVTPYIAFWVPEHLGGSGVLATVATGLYISWNGPMLIPSATRLQGVFFWDLLTYLIEGLVFLLTGLQARTLIDRIGVLPARELLVSAVVISVVVIVARFVWVFPATYLPRWLVPAIARRDPSPPWQAPFMLAFTGIRGIVSLAAALALPLATASGEPFPDRDLILFLTFCVIVVTLVGQGLLMPTVIRWLGLTDMGRGERQLEEAEELARRQQTIEAVLRRLEELAAERNLPMQIVEPVRAYHRERLQQLEYRIGADELNKQLARLSAELELLLIGAERQHLYELLSGGQLKDDARRRIERELDLREAQLRRTTPRSGNDDT